MTSSPPIIFVAEVATHRTILHLLDDLPLVLYSMGGSCLIVSGVMVWIVDVVVIMVGVELVINMEVVVIEVVVDEEWS